MKKLLIRALVGIVILAVIGLAVLWFSLNSIVKKGVETAGPYLTKTEVKLAGVNLSLFSGRGELKGLLVGTPEGYKAPSSVTMGRLAVSVQVGSVTSDKIVVRSIEIEAPEITLEGGLSKNNLTQIMANLEAATGGSKTAATDKTASKAEQKAGKKIQVDDLVIRNAKVHVLLFGAGEAPVSIPEIHLTGLGASGDGITVADLSQRVFKEILGKTTTSVSATATKLGKDLNKLATDSVKNAASDLQKAATKGLGDLLGK